jgi:hypothetical protein
MHPASRNSPSAVVPARLVWKATQTVVVIRVAAPFSQQTNMPAECYVGFAEVVFKGQNMGYK